jgi:hypothetical protein
MRTREGMKVAKAKGRQSKRPPARQATQGSVPRQEAHLVTLYHAGEHSMSELAELFPLPAPRCIGPSSATRPGSSTLRRQP